MEGIFLGDRTDEFGRPDDRYCTQALMDTALYQLVKLGHYTERQLNDPDEVSAEYAARLLRADGAFGSATREAQLRAASKRS